MDFLRSLMIAASGLKVQNGRMRVIAENIANADSTASTPGGDPYRRKTVSFKNQVDRQIGAELVKIRKVGLDPSEFKRHYDPGHPAADTVRPPRYASQAR